MKCPQCQKLQKYKDGLTCHSCHYQWIFNPKSDPITDNKMRAAIAKVSGQDTYNFTDQQLYAECCRRAAQPVWIAYLFGVIAFGAAVMIGVNFEGATKAILLLPLLAGVVLVAMGRYYSQRPPFSRQHFDRLLKRWDRLDSLQSLVRWIREPQLQQPPPEWQEPDIYDYGFQRLLIVERDILVDLLVLNEFHLANQTLVIAESGYPDYLVPLVQKALREQSDLHVYLLHDATPFGLQMRERIRQSKVFPGVDERAIDVGLNPPDVSKLKGLRKIRADRFADGVPLDLLLSSTLLPGLAASLETRQPLSALMDPSGEPGATSFG